MESLRVALVQMRCEKGAVEANLAAMRRTVRAAAERDVDVVVFPEASISGYVDPLRYPDAVLRLDGPQVARFAEATRGVGLTAVGGMVELSPEGKPWLTQAVATDGMVTAWYRKRTIPRDEEEMFQPGMESGIFEHRGTKLGLAICADIDNATVFSDCAALGAQAVFEVAAPGLYGEQPTRDWQSGYDWWRTECHTKLSRYARDNGIVVAVATQAGRTADEDFPGGGYVFGPDGSCITESGDWFEGVLYADLPVGLGIRET